MQYEPFITERCAEGFRVTAAVPGHYSLFYSVSPDGFTPDAALADFTDCAAVADPLPGQRCWFHILDEAANHWVTATRILDFSTVENFRELGGYPAADGCFVRWGRFYRTARLTHLNEEETARLQQLGIRTLLDLRSEKEIALHPDPQLAGAERKAVSAIVEMDGSGKDFDPAYLVTQSTDEMEADAAAFMDIYRAMPFGNPAYRWMFDRLLEGKAPLLFHCTAGKDRTGIASALILLALGTPRAVIEADYMLTNVCCRAGIEKMLANCCPPGAADFVRGYITCLAGVGLQNLAAALDAIASRYESPAAFFEAEYGLDADKLARLRRRYTERPHP